MEKNRVCIWLIDHFFRYGEFEVRYPYLVLSKRKL